jgi:hypothetical protein
MYLCYEQTLWYMQKILANLQSLVRMDIVVGVNLRYSYPCLEYVAVLNAYDV